jgi:hypothetical protein
MAIMSYDNTIERPLPPGYLRDKVVRLVQIFVFLTRGLTSVQYYVVSKMWMGGAQFHLSRAFDLF